jgi:hypothetical protein
MGSGALGNNRYAAVISYQIAIVMNAVIENVARLGVENVDKDENDMPTHVHNERMESQAEGFLIGLSWGVRAHGA